VRESVFDLIKNEGHELQIIDKLISDLSYVSKYPFTEIRMHGADKIDITIPLDRELKGAVVDFIENCMMEKKRIILNRVKEAINE
jgi:hypothetical protein